MHEVEISPEIAKLAASRTRNGGAALSDELARSVVQEAVYALDAEAELLIDEDKAFSSNDALVAGFAVNDVVINGHRLDVRAIDEEGRVSLSRALVGTAYMTAGTLAVKMNGRLHGQVVAFVPASEWDNVDHKAGDQQVLFVKPPVDDSFDLSTTLGRLKAASIKRSSENVSSFELATFVASRAELPLEKQRSLVQAVLTNPGIWPEVARVVSTWARSSIRRIISDASTWNARVERITDLAAAKFKRLSREDVRKIVHKIGETYGGQPESPSFRQALLSSLTREELAHSMGGAALKKAASVAEAVLSGRAVSEAIKDVARNPVALQIAEQIKAQRRKTASFVDATAQELSAAFQQLALQPAYATHTSDPASGVESINEALKMLDAAELAESIQALDQELAAL